MRLGIERLLQEEALRKSLRRKRVALVAHPASVDRSLHHSLDLLKSLSDLNVCAAFGPQHGMRGEKQDNMVESADYLDPVYKIPVFSLYGEVRRPTEKMLDAFDVVLVDLQDVGCRIYTFLTTLFYLLEACAAHNKEIWVLDRPNPAGRPVEGLKLDMRYESFVGAAPVPMRHGLTLGEAGLWYVRHKDLKVDYRVVEMKDYDPKAGPGFGWPQEELSWVNPSPNIPRLTCARMYAGTVLIEGTLLSEGRGTTIPLEVIGAPPLNGNALVEKMKSLAPSVFEGCRLRPCFFEPTFQKFKGELCSGIQIHIDIPEYDHVGFKPFRLVSIFLKAVRQLYPDLKVWRPPPYEYETVKMPFDILSGSDWLRSWIDNPKSTYEELNRRLLVDEEAWQEEREEFLLY